MSLADRVELALKGEHTLTASQIALRLAVPTDQVRAVLATDPRFGKDAADGFIDHGWKLAA